MKKYKKFIFFCLFGIEKYHKIVYNIYTDNKISLLSEFLKSATSVASSAPDDKIKNAIL